MRDRFFWLFGVPAIMVAIGAALLLPSFFHFPAPSCADSIIRALQVDCAPKPFEHLRFLFLLIFPALTVFGFSFAGIYSLRMPGLRSFLNTRLARILVYFLQIGLLGVILFMLWAQNRQHAYVDRWFYLRAFAWTSAVLVGWYYCWFDRISAFCFRWVPVILAGGLVVWGQTSAIFPDRNIWTRESVIRTNLSYSFGEVAALVNGKTPRVDFFPQYQNLIGFLGVPLFKWFGVSVTSFTVLMAALSTIGLMFLFFSLYRAVRNSWRALFYFVAILAVSFLPVQVSKGLRFSVFAYYGVSPFRYFGVWLAAAALALYLGENRRSSRWTRPFLFCISALALLNNLDFGFPAHIAVLFVILLKEIPGWNVVTALHSVVRRVSEFVLATALVFAGYSVLAYVRAGKWPDWGASFAFQRAFTYFGFMTLPTPAFGLHWVIYLTLVSALAVSVFRRISRPHDFSVAEALLGFSALSGLGISAYYANRSHWEVLHALFPAWSFSLVLLLECHPLMGSSSFRIDVLRNRWRFIPFACLVFGVVACASLVGTYPNAYRELQRIARNEAPNHPTRGELAAFVKDRTTADEPVVIAHPVGFLVAIDAGVRNVFPFSQPGSLILLSQVRRVRETIEENHVRSVFGTFPDELKIELGQLGFVPSTDSVFPQFEYWTR